MGKEFEKLSDAELKELMSTIGAACDVVRVVDPSDFEARTLAPEGGCFSPSYKCHSALVKGRRCENCISMRAIVEEKPVSKFEFVDGDAYFIMARPIEFEGRPHTIEMVTKVSDEIGTHEGLVSLQEQMQSEIDVAFIDSFTGAYSFKYFDEGLRMMRGRKLAMAELDNLASINEELGHATGDAVLKHVAHELMLSTRIEDSVIRYKGGKFIVQFEDMDHDDFAALVSAASEAVNAPIDDNGLHVQPIVRIAAIDEDGTNGQLAEKALALLKGREYASDLVIMESADTGYQAAPQIRMASDAESLHHGPDRQAIDKDELTGFATSSAIRTYIRHLIRERHAASEGYCIICLDIENFKQFNRMYGVQGGDMLLKFVARRIVKEFPEGVHARTSADIFIVVTNESDVEGRLKRLHDAVAAYQSRLTCRIMAGVLRVDKAVHDADMAIGLAKAACESIKGCFDQTVRFYDSELDRAMSINEYVVNNIDHAIAEGHIEVYYQPIIRTVTGRPCNFEALARWNDPHHGLLSPGVFVGALEHYHLINKLDEHIVHQTCRHQAKRIAAGQPSVPVSVNLSRIDFQLCDVFSMVEHAVSSAGIPRSLLIIEITESAFNENVKFFSGQIERFLDAGYEVWMDDFGNGYSAFNQLKDYRFSTLKIDMEFLSNFETNPKSREIIVTIVDMAKKLGIRTLVEGVETKQQYRFLQRIGCEMLQGFYFGKPRPYGEGEFFEEPVEGVRERAYFNEIGSVNLLGLPTNDSASEPGNYVTESESRSIPIALVEHRGDAYRYLSANEPYLALLSSWHADFDGNVQDALAAGLFSPADSLASKIQQVTDGQLEKASTYAVGDERYQVLIRHVTTGPDASAFAVILLPIA